MNVLFLNSGDGVGGVGGLDASKYYNGCDVITHNTTKTFQFLHSAEEANFQILTLETHFL